MESHLILLLSEKNCHTGMEYMKPSIAIMTNHLIRAYEGYASQADAHDLVTAYQYSQLKTLEMWLS